MKAVIFDLDQTLVDLMRMKEHCMQASVDAMIDAGLELSRHRALVILRKMYIPKIEDQRIFQRFLRRTTGRVDPRMLAYAVLAYRRVKSGFLTPYPGTKETLETLKTRGLKLAIVSDAPRDQAWQRLCAMQLDRFFDAVVTYDDTKHRKPSSRPFLRAVKMLGLKPEDCLMVGDWPEGDITGAKRLGMRTAYARYGNTRAGKSGADFVLGRISDVLKLAVLK